MSTSADGDGRPDNGGFDDLPDLPADWGSIVIPDDPAELAAEAAQVRRELRRRARRDAWRRRLGLASATTGPAPLRLALVIMSVAIIATLISLFAFAWPGQRPTATVRTSPGNQPDHTLPALDLLGEDGGLVPLRSLLPAMIIIADGCPCAEELDAARRAAPPGVNVVVVRTRQTTPGARPATTPGDGPALRFLTDPASELRTSLHLTAPPGTASALVVTRSGEIIRTVPELTTSAEYQADLARLSSAG
ncbi:hypothetical protein [Micromonospora sp. HM5-17]|jgi:hypothetical protein|uniref:hypothetical protein n=1 Tax=Micromonospora sp. HM5-17 TaxID=2487710 RepID=UPI000F4A13C1|nr:hypothetical protein [Micromonospora sp. HM5-17]ROT28062.1 hypothetical protein EF879_22860 [Micromonospora sp. HM5-17]